MLDAPSTPCKLGVLQDWERPQLSQLSQVKFSSFPHPWTAEHIKPEALQASRGKKKKNPALYTGCVCGSAPGAMRG